MKHTFFIFSLLIVFGCSNDDATTIHKADIHFTNGVIWTAADTQTSATDLVVNDGRISFVGDTPTDTIKANQTIDLGGAFLMPGFQDNHTHFIEGGGALSSLKLGDVTSPLAFKSTVEAFAAAQPEGRWIMDGRWDHEKWGGELPHRDWIDGITPNSPALIFRLDGHLALANTLALEMAGITKDTPDPEGGVIDRDADGEATGILRDNALSLVLKIVPPKSDEALVEDFLAAQAHALSLGLVKVHVLPGGATNTRVLKIAQKARAEGKLKIRSFVSAPIKAWDVMADASKEGGGDALLSWGGVKGYMDGALGSRTAWMHQPYLDEMDNSGLPVTAPDELRTLMRLAAANDLTLSIHGIGDRAIDTIIDTMAEIGGDTLMDKRWRLEHYQHPTAEAITRLSNLGIIASMQPVHAIDDGNWASGRLGEKRLETTYALRDILDSGGVLTFGSDWPVAPLDPLKGVYAAVTRRTGNGENPDGWIPTQKISVEEALTAYTKSNAFAFGDEDRAGTLEVGKNADFIILSDDPRVINPTDIPKLRVLQTWIDGEIVYQAHVK